ncbi:asparaginase [Massilia sp. Leaf139]|uniref:asparaginase n=1 Tax=Massilia sp. Leaf139 TaxID=1736272 RepID=UPI0006F522A6|nr:asparaginase [Massilia sp. Leaf139]KQQ86883.1 asparagine amidohydrolase [Massilia sp. Leaf139]
MHAAPVVPLVATTRGYPAAGYTVENVHAGAIAVVNRDGRLLAWAGDPQYQTFTRSALKPFQALPFLLSEGAAKFGLAQEELALLCASHSGEEKHLAGVRSILGKIGLDIGHLECGCGVPLYYEYNNLPVPQDESWTPLHHNCSGKHSGFLAWCRHHGAATTGYVEPDHPLQKAIRGALADAANLPESSMPTGIDGCSAPNYALPLASLAHLYARLAQGEQDARLGQALGPLFDAMTGRPDMVSGTERSDLVLMTAGGGDWVAKIGADAVQAIGIRSQGIGIAIKIADGNNRGLHTITYNVLDQLGLLDDAKRAVLERFRQPQIRNARGTVAGDMRTLFTLQRA